MLALRPALASFLIATVALGNVAVVADLITASPDQPALFRCGNAQARLARAKADARNAELDAERLERELAVLDRRIDDAMRALERDDHHGQIRRRPTVNIPTCCLTNVLCCL